MKKKKVGKIIAIFFLIILVLSLGYLVYSYLNSGTEEEKIERKLKKMTKSFYEDYYYDLLVESKGSKEDAITYLKAYKDNGLKISYDSLKTYYDQKAGMNYTELASCDENETKVVVYPKEPYGNKDYTLDYILSCDILKATEEMKKFKKEYEKYNNVDNRAELFIDEYNLIKYSSLEEVNKMIEEKKSFVVFLGNPYYNETRFSVDAFITVSKEYNIDTIYYVDIIKDNKEENDIRTKYEINNSVVTKVKDGTKDYIKFVQTCNDILPSPYDDCVSQGDKTIFNSAYIYVEEGIPTIYTDGLPTDTKDYEIVEDSVFEEIFREFYNKRKAN